MLADVATELTSSRGFHLSASDCAELLRRHREQITAVLDQMSLMQRDSALDDLSSADVTNVCGINLRSVHSPLLPPLSESQRDSFCFEFVTIYYVCYLCVIAGKWLEFKVGLEKSMKFKRLKKSSNCFGKREDSLEKFGIYLSPNIHPMDVDLIVD